MTNGGRTPIRIGEWLAEPATNTLRRGDEVARLEPKAMDVLVRLAAEPGQVVSREALFATAWPGMVVGDEALSQSITKLRRALGDDPRTPRYIETISKRGYRLVAPVGEPRQASAPASGSHLSLPRAIAALALVPLAALAFAAWRHATVPATPAAVEDRQAAAVTVTVLPFEAPAPDGRQAYLARGIADELVTRLGRIGGLRVIGAAGASPEQAASRARYLVAGSVQREGDMLRMHVRLTDARTHEQLWGERFERRVADFFDVQDEIARKLAEALPAKITQAERQRLAQRHTRSLEAYDEFLQAQALFLARGAAQNRAAQEHYRRAVELDPQFARAYAGLAMTHAMEHRLGGDASSASLERAMALASTAREIDPASAEVQWSLGFVHTQARRYPEAMAAMQRAIEINPSFADAHALLGGIHTYLGEPAKAIGLLRTALRLEPDGGYLYFLLLGRAYYFAGDLEQAAFNLKAASARNPADLETHVYLAATALSAGNRTAAEWEALEIRALDPAFTPGRWLASYPLASAPHRERLRQALAEILPEPVEKPGGRSTPG